MSKQEQKRKNDLFNQHIRAKLIMCNYTKQEFAKALHMSLASFYNRLNNPDTFTRKEIQTIFYRLKFTPDEILQVI